MGKKKKEPQLEAWCWYCDREFEDDKVLLEHQKAKHYRCPYCPRRLNTAGGLTVHLHQVHKAEPTKIENALPGRESFDVEIYGMVGIPEADLAEWKSRRVLRQGGSGGIVPGAKRQKIENVALTPAQLKAQLEAHKALMSGKAPPPGAIAGQFNPPPMIGPPPPMMGYPPTGPPPGFGIPPPPMYNRPPPGFVVPPLTHNAPPPLPPPPLGAGPYTGPPPGFYQGPPPNLNPQPPPPPAIPITPIAIPHISLPSVNPHQEAVKAGAKSRMVYNDLTLSPEEKLASTSKYLYIDSEDSIQSWKASNQKLRGIDYSPVYAADTSQPLAQSYPAISGGGQGGIEPASANPEENTAEALTRANYNVRNGMNREIDAIQMQKQANKDREQVVDTDSKPVGISDAAAVQSSPMQGSTRQGRAKAADLF